MKKTKNGMVSIKNMKTHKFCVQEWSGRFWTLDATFKTLKEAKDLKKKLENKGFLARVCKYNPVSNQE